MTTDHATQRWSIRSTLVAVTNLDRSVAFYRELGPFEELAREDAVAVLGESSPESLILLLRETRGGRHGQQSLGLRSIIFNIGSAGELDRIESVLRAHDLFTSRSVRAGGVSELISGRDPDNLPLAFVCYADGGPIGTDYYRSITDLVYSLDI
jgi:catechol 2,3-dioxygenase-like lactoylglutathione lyase family enzyme